MECDKEFRSHVCAAHRRAKNPNPTMTLRLRSYDEGAADEQRPHEGRVKQRALQKDVPKQGE
jgi:hypothetical protein